MRYRFAGKGKLLALGVYPDVSLAEARVRRDDARNGESAPVYLKHISFEDGETGEIISQRVAHT